MASIRHQPLTLDRETRAVLPTAEAAHHLNRPQQTLRIWAMRESGPIQPHRINGRLAWPVAEIKRLLGGDLVRMSSEKEAVTAISGGARKLKASQDANMLSTPWHWHARELRTVASEHVFTWNFYSMVALVDMVRMLQDAADGIAIVDNQFVSELKDGLGSLAVSICGAHAGANFSVSEDGSIKVCANLDEARRVFDIVDAPKASAARRRCKSPQVVMANRPTGDVSEVFGLYKVFQVLIEVRDAAYQALDYAAWRAQDARLSEEPGDVF